MRNLQADDKFACQAFFSFMRACLKLESVEGFFLTIEQRNKQSILLNKLSLKCFDPSVAFASMTKERYHSLILTSGTLKPLETFGKELGIKFDHFLETKHVI